MASYNNNQNRGPSSDSWAASEEGWQNPDAAEESLRVISAVPQDNEGISDEELRPLSLDNFIGQPRLKPSWRCSSMPHRNAASLLTIYCLQAPRGWARRRFL